MPMFSHGNKSSRHTRKKKISLAKRIKKLFKKSPPREEHIGQKFIDKFQVMFLRTIILIVGAFSWWIFTNILFLAILPTFGVYNTWISNFGTDIYSVYQFWTVIPFIFIFMFGIFWSSGVIDLLRGNRAFEKVF